MTARCHFVLWNHRVCRDKAGNNDVTCVWRAFVTGRIKCHADQSATHFTRLEMVRSYDGLGQGEGKKKNKHTHMASLLDPKTAHQSLVTKTWLKVKIIYPGTYKQGGWGEVTVRIEVKDRKSSVQPAMTITWGFSEIKECLLVRWFLP